MNKYDHVINGFWNLRAKLSGNRLTINYTTDHTNQSELLSVLCSQLAGLGDDEIVVRNTCTKYPVYTYGVQPKELCDTLVLLRGHIGWLFCSLR